MSTSDPVGLLRVLVEHEVEFVVIGHAAAVLQGSPTVTQDLDVTPRQLIDNAERLAEALRSLHALHLGTDVEIDERDFHGWRTQRFRTDLGPIDVVPEPLAIGGYEELAPRAMRFIVAGVEVLAASLDDVIASKEALDRPKDRAQLPALYATRAALRHDRE